MGAGVSFQDIDIDNVYRRGIKEMVANLSFVNLSGGWRKAGKVMEVRKRAAEFNPTSIGLSADTELRGVRIFDHLTPKKQKLLFEAKKLKESDH